MLAPKLTLLESAGAVGAQIRYTPSGASPSCCETTAATGPVTLCSRTGQSEGPEESRVRKLRPMIEADAPSTSSLATHGGVVLCPPHRSSHGRTAGDSVQRFKDAKLRPRQAGEVPKCAARGIIKSGALRASGPTIPTPTSLRQSPRSTRRLTTPTDGTPPLVRSIALCPYG